MRLLPLAAGLLALAPAALADLTVDQKVADFMDLVGLYAKNYGPYELKLDYYGFDLYDTAPWLAQVKASQTDIDFYDICVKYVASLRDSHDEFTIWSSYDAWLHFNGDIYDGKFLIDTIDRAYLPTRKFPFQIGDELVSVDGVAVADLLTQFAPYSVNGSSNLVSQARIAAATITERYQGWYPRANNIGLTATIVVNRKVNNMEATYVIPWDVLGDAVTTAGVLPSPPNARAAKKSQSVTRMPVIRPKGEIPSQETADILATLFSKPGPPLTPNPPTPAYMQPMMQLRNFVRATGPTNFRKSSGLEPFGSFTPPFLLPLFNLNFNVRLGYLTTDQFLSGTFQTGGHTYGYIRIPTMEPDSEPDALTQFAGEIEYFQSNVDGLIVDVMGNGGGDGCYSQTLASMLIPGTFQGLVQELRASLSWKYSFSSIVVSAQEEGAPGWVVADYQFMSDAVDAALNDNRARTGGLPLCSYSADSSPYFDANGVQAIYTKPMIVLTDNFTLSAAEIFTMFVQDNGRAPIVGTTTDGGGGDVVSFDAGSYSEGSTRITLGVIERGMPFQVPGFPALSYYDGVGIYPDVWLDYMTASNLQTGGVDFLGGALSALASQLPPVSQ
ncbi:MAG TPA: S41 family peptidase [Bryobacteraceae bacterium]|jgi:hypothetical protein